jgi:hypothetical protein
MKTAKRNARTEKIFNNVMHAVTSMYGIYRKRKLRSVYDILEEKDDFIFHFLDADGKVIYNTFGPNKDLINKGRRVSLVDSDNYIKVINPETRQFFIDIHKFDINQFDNDTFISYLIDRIDSLSESYFIRDLCKDYIRRAHQEKNYRALILFETIFGYQFLTRKQIDRIRYITFSNDEIYDVMNGYMIPGHVICLLKQKYFVRSIPTNDDGKIASRYGDKGVISKVIDDELIPRTLGTVETVNYVKILNGIVFKKIKNMLLSFGRGLSQEEIYDICGSIMLELNPSIKHLIPDYHPIFKERVDKLFKDKSSFILKNQFQLKHILLTDGKKNYCVYQEKQESNT